MKERRKEGKAKRKEVVTPGKWRVGLGCWMKMKEH